MEENLAKEIKGIMKQHNIKAQYLIDKGVNKQQVYSVLRMGNPKRRDYKISTLLKVLKVLNIELIFNKKK